MKVIFNRFTKNISQNKAISIQLAIALILLMLSFFAFKAYLTPCAEEKKPDPAKVNQAIAKGVCNFSYDDNAYKVKYKKYIPDIRPIPKETKIRETRKDKAKKAFKKISFKANYPYKILVNRKENFVTIMGINKMGKYKIPYKTFVCSTAKDKKNTPLGTFHLNDKYRWHQMVDGSYSQYAIRLYGGFMLHSIPYYEQKPDTLETEEYNKLGTNASLGCVRLRISAVKWIYDKCPTGTAVEVYDKRGEKPHIPLVEVQKLDTKDKNSNWDPTDPNKKNPWNKKK